jgi:hypothetical protein
LISRVSTDKLRFYQEAMKTYNAFLAAFIILFSIVICDSAAILYVNVNSSNPQPPYTSWNNASKDIQSAIDAASDGDQIFVTNGVYLTGGRVVYGSLTNRVVINKAVTVQSINGPALTIIEGHRDASTVVGDDAVRCVYLTNNVSLSGFTLAGGATRSSGDVMSEQSGGGVWCESTNVVITNCIFLNDAANNAGGAVERGNLNKCTLMGNASVLKGGGADSSILSNCTLTNNWTVTITAPLNNAKPLFLLFSMGGGAENSILNNCILTGNQAVGGAGGGADSSQLIRCTLISNLAPFGAGAASSTLNSCLIISNSASVNGGGAYSCSLINCIINGNSAQNGGGAMFGSLDSCTVIENSASAGGGVYGNSGAITLNDCIIYDNSPNNYTGVSQINYCCTTPIPAAGLGNITNDPVFVNLAMGNFRLQTNSLCIDVGNGSPGPTDLDGRPRFVGEAIDMGAYEFQGVGIGEFIVWLQQYALSIDGSSDYIDSDGDHMNNWQEWIAGTIPTNVASVLKLSPPSNNAFGLTVTWQSVNTRTYYLQSSTNLDTPFHSIQSNLVGQAVSTSYTDTGATNGGPYFYRVGVQ